MKRGVDSVEVAARILRALAQSGGTARLKELAELTGLAPPKIHRYLVSLIEGGLVRRCDGQHYAFGLLAYQIGQTVSQQNDLLSVAEGEIQALVDQVGTSCGFAVWVDSGATILRWFHPAHEITLSIRADPGMQLTGSTTGQVFAAFLPRDVIEPILRTELGVEPGAPSSALEAVLATFSRVRHEGYAYAHSIRTPGINAFSVPVFDVAGHVAGALTMIGHEQYFSADPGSESAMGLRQLATRLSNGARPQRPVGT